MIDDVGDFVLSIDVPDEFALARVVREEPPLGWPFCEIWLKPEEANQYHHTLTAFDSISEEEVPLGLVGK